MSGTKVAAIHDNDANKFPTMFKFGVGTAAYQVEGAWNSVGKTESIWDFQSHNFPSKFANEENADVACEAFTYWQEDIANLKMLNVDFYRFSLSWCRILPSGFANHINSESIDHYKTFAHKLLDSGIHPVVTLYHWDLPQKLQEFGGWTNPRMADIFAQYARVCFGALGDVVKMWLTFDSPNRVAQAGYGDGSEPPCVDADGIGTYLAAHTMLLAHAKAYALFQSEFRHQNGVLGIALDCPWCEPYTTAKADVEAAERWMQMYLGWFAHPIFDAAGDYPPEMRQRVNAYSDSQGFPSSRLPVFAEEEVRLVRGSADFFGVNHFGAYYVANANVGLVPSNDHDAGAHCFVDEAWVATARTHQRCLPWAIASLLRWLDSAYGRPQMMITGNGYPARADDVAEEFNDTARIAYIESYLAEVLRAIKLYGCNVSAYTYWTFMDCFEWTDAYRIRSGLYFVDFRSTDRKRHAKRSAYAYRNIIATHRLVGGHIDAGTLVELSFGSNELVAILD